MIGESAFGVYHGGASVDEVAKGIGGAIKGYGVAAKDYTVGAGYATRNGAKVAGANAKMAGKLYKKPLIAGAAGTGAVGAGVAGYKSRKKVG